MNGTISLKDALQIIDLKDNNNFPIPFDITYRTLQRNSKKGGALKEVKQATLLSSSSKSNSSFDIESLKILPKTIKNPHHFENRTRNLQKPNKEIFKVHIRLIISINSQNVVY